MNGILQMVGIFLRSIRIVTPYCSESSITERKSGYALINKLSNKTSDLVSNAIITKMNPVSLLVKTLTFDNVVWAKIYCQTLMQVASGHWSQNCLHYSR